MENSFLYKIKELRVYSTPIWTYKCTGNLSIFINTTLQKYLDIFVTAYFNDILVYIKNKLKKHVEIIQ